MPVIPPDESVGLSALSRLAGVFKATFFLAATFFAGAFFAGALAAAVFLTATFFAVAFCAGAFEVVVVDAAVFVFLTDACLLERVLVVTGFFAPVGAAFFFAAGLAFADVFWVQAASTPWRRIEPKPLVYQTFLPP